MSAPDESDMVIKTGSDIVLARQAVREAARALGFESTDTTRIVTAASELARNLLQYAGEGVMILISVKADERCGIELQFVDHGPGISNVEKALEEGYSTSGGLGLGLPGAQRLMDEMVVQSVVGQGTTVTVRKWRKKRPAGDAPPGGEQGRSTLRGTQGGGNAAAPVAVKDPGHGS